MVAILRVQAKWSGFPGAPGYSSFHFRDFGTGSGDGLEPDIAQAQSAADRLRTFFGGMATKVPGSATIEIESEVEMLESTTGALIDILPISPPLPVDCLGAVSYSGPVGGVVNWKTSLVHRGRRIRGRTFLVPFTSDCFSTTGGLDPTIRDDIQSHAEVLSANPGTPDLGVWSRPSAAGATDGQWAVVASCNVPLLAAVLRSRRD